MRHEYLLDLFLAHTDSAVLDYDAFIRYRNLYRARICVEDRITYKIAKQHGQYFI